jgi:hypothetical protein
LGPERLARPGEDGATPAGRVRPLLQHLADAAADAAGRDRRPVPVLADRALPDQLVVLVADLLADLPDDDQAAVADVHHRLVALRRSL